MPGSLQGFRNMVLWITQGFCACATVSCGNATDWLLKATAFGCIVFSEISRRKDDIMNFSQNLINLRKKAGLSQDKLAEQLHITRQAVSKWESGASVPDADTLMQLCSILGVSPNQLLLDCQEPGRDSTNRAPASDDRMFVISSVFVMFIFLSGTGLLALYLHSGGRIHELVAYMSLLLMFGSIVTYLIMVLKRRFRKK